MASYEQLAKRLVQRARAKGARQAEAFLEVGRQSTCRVRDGQLERLTEATSKGVGLRVIRRDRLGFAYTSDFERASLDAFVDRALALAEAAAPSKLNGLPGRKELPAKQADAGELFDREVADLPSDWKIHTALEMERAGRAVDPRITTFDSVGAGDYVSEVYLASSEGFSGGYAGTYVYLYATPVASESGQLQTGQWIDYKRFLGELESPEAVGRRAAQRALRMLGARKVKTQRVPVVLDPLVAASFVSSIASAASGDLVHKRSSFLAPLLGKRVGPSWLAVVDDGLRPRGLSTAPFDGEGVPSRRTPIIEGGVLRSFLYDTFTARKAGAKTTGNAARGYRSHVAHPPGL